jgi:hypothetical protein
MFDRGDQLTPDESETVHENQSIGPALTHGPYPATLEQTIADLRLHLGEEIAREAAETLRRMFDRANRWTRNGE